MSFKKVLVLILNSGEGELQRSLATLDNQTYKNWSKVIFSGLSNKTAHDTLYNYIMSHKDEYDLFIKLDADMVLTSNQTLEEIVKYFEKNPNVDQANFAVYDVMSDQNIMGLLTFTNKVRWNGSEEKLFVDYTPTIPGKRLLVWGQPSPVALHCMEPTPFQAFHYGAHRAMKALQSDRLRINKIQSAIQWHLLYRVWTIFTKFYDKNRALMMVGAYSLWIGEVDENANEYDNESLRNAFNKYCDLSGVEIQSNLKEWEKVVTEKNWLYRLLWLKLEIYKFRCRLANWFNSYLNSTKRL